MILSSYNHDFCRIHTFGLKYRAEEHPDSRAQMFETMRYNKRKIRDLVQALEGFERVLELRSEFMRNFGSISRSACI
ncbi:unnamed protein product [Gongylonema pulchrum]|uniref:Transposase n=1 Tax=Gongylonema pulchrum TaxID=637853 RepID=A0A183DLA7_9BILA|nr:unnamed protein product [Gongylonema pulchrum]